MLHRRRIELAGDADEQFVALVAVVGMHAHLDELVRSERDVDLVQHRGREPRVADRNDRVQRVGASAQLAALRGCERDHAGSVAEGRTAQIDAGRPDRAPVREVAKRHPIQWLRRVAAARAAHPAIRLP
ncbi:hypothetical protein BURK1_03751 [Burkholderiales bacterium]|nr:hypothetical protein BURK1_03751 [Burkholderiales bacterium]